MVSKVKEIVEKNDSLLGRGFDFTIQGLIVCSLIAFALETLPDLSPAQRAGLQWFEIFTVTIFTVEYILRMVVADDKLRFATSFYGIVDLLAILPFYISIGVDLRSIRAFRLLRLFRAFKLVRYSQAIGRIHRAFLIAKEELVLFCSVTAIVLYLAAVGIYYCEHDVQPEAFGSVFDSLWWAVVTLTTVGYGDVYPVTLGGRIFTTIVLFVGLGIVSIPAGLVASALSQARSMEVDSSQAASDQLVE